MVLNWLWNLKYSKKHVNAVIVFQKYTRGFIARKRVEQIHQDIETKKQFLLVWHTISQQTRQIESMCENNRLDMDVCLKNIPKYHKTLRTYQKERSRMVEQVINLDRYMNQIDNVGEPLPCRMFPVKGLFIQGIKI